MDAMKPSKRQLCRQAMKAPLNLTALPPAGEGRDEGENRSAFGGFKARGAPWVYTEEPVPKGSCYRTLLNGTINSGEPVYPSVASRHLPFARGGAWGPKRHRTSPSS